MAVIAIAGAIVFLITAAMALFLPTAARRGAWLPVHLVLAGGATTAIAGVMPFFAAAFAAAPPSDARLRMAAVVAVAGGAVAVSVGVVGSLPSVAVGGGTAFIAGVIATGVATIRPLARALGPSRGLITQGYVVALGEVAVGATLATLFVAGWAPIVEAWARIKPVHAWLNLVGFVSLVVATTLLHFLPTVVGARITVRRSARLTVLGIAAGAPLVALGSITAVDGLARIGALVTLGGTGALVVNAAGAWRARARWTTDPGWHRFAMGALVTAIGWFVVGIGMAASRVLVTGGSLTSFSIDTFGAPLVAGWVGLAILGSATHLLPAVGPGDLAAHARQRRLLAGRAATRLTLINGGVAGLALGWPLDHDGLLIWGAVLLAAGLGWTAALLVRAIAIGAAPQRPA